MSTSFQELTVWMAFSLIGRLFPGNMDVGKTTIWMIPLPASVLILECATRKCTAPAIRKKQMFFPGGTSPTLEPFQHDDPPFIYKLLPAPPSRSPRR